MNPAVEPQQAKSTRPSHATVRESADTSREALKASDKPAAGRLPRLLAAMRLAPAMHERPRA